MISTILIRNSEAESNDEWVVIDSLAQFALQAGKRGHSVNDLPVEVLWNSQVTQAFNQINRNGPSLYFYNVLAAVDGTDRWNLIVNATKAGLAALGDIPQVSGFDRIMDAYAMHRDEILTGRQNTDPYKIPNNFNLLLGFMSSSEDENKFMACRVAWIRSLRNLTTVPDSDYEVALAKLLAS